MLRFLTLAFVLAFASNATAGEAGPADSAAAHAPMTLRSIAAGTGVEDRQLQGESDAFKTGAPVWVHIAVRNPGPPGTVTMIWSLEGDAVWEMDLDVGTSGGWRTWTRMRMPASRTGQWTVEVRDSAGEKLGEVSFDVVGRSTQPAIKPTPKAASEDAPAETAALFDDEPGC